MDKYQVELHRKIITQLWGVGTNDKDERIIDIGDVHGFGTLYQKADEDVYLLDKKTGAKIGLGEVNEDIQYDLYVYLDANWRTLKSRDEIVVEVEKDARELEWVEVPSIVKNRDEEIGVVGVYVAEVTDGEELRGIRFVSPDGSYATLTMYGQDSEVEKGIARDDLDAIAERIKGYKARIV